MTAGPRDSFVVGVAEQLHSISHQYYGRHALDDKRKRFVPLQRLKNFWKDDRQIESVLNSYAIYMGSFSLRPEIIRDRFIRLFSLLVAIERVHCIEQFSSHGLEDARFPLEKFPQEWKTTRPNKELYSMISAEQWVFFPVIFESGELYSQAIPPQRILPIEYEEIIRQGTGVSLFRASLEGSSTFANPANNGKAQVVRKQYRGEKRRVLFERERQAFETLQSRTCKHIVQCYGSYIQKEPDGKETYSLILEHFGAGNLDEFFRTVLPPQNKRQLINFWKSFRGLFAALYIIHNTTTADALGVSNSQIVHQDIKPQNILVSSKSLDEEQVLLKVIDFGYSFTRLSEVTDFIDLGGSQTYGPPECSHHGQYRNNARNPITPAADIWSAGGILSEAAAWVADGQAGRRLYEKAREEEAEHRKAFKNAGHGGCFHNGIERLQTVDMTHRNILDKLPAYDDVTPQILSLVEEALLVPMDQRKAAWEIREKLGLILDPVSRSTQIFVATTPSTPPTPADSTEKRRDSGVKITSPVPDVVEPPDDRWPEAESPSTPQPRRPPLPGLDVHRPSVGNSPNPDRLSPSRGPSRHDHMSLEEAIKYIDDRKNNRLPDRRVSRIVQMLKDNLQHRDHIFFVDNSETLRAHYKDVIRTLRAYAYIAKLIDTNGIEAGYSTKPRLQKHKSTKALIKSLEKQSWNSVAFEDGFSNFIDSVIGKLPLDPRLPAPFRPKKRSIFVLTDGCWGDGDGDAGACGVEGPIQRLIKAMQKRNIDRTHVMIQFMRFGDDAQGTRHLEFLDDFGVSFKMDFVDTKPFNYNMTDMFFGAISPDADKGDEESRPASQARSSVSEGRGSWNGSEVEKRGHRYSVGHNGTHGSHGCC